MSGIRTLIRHATAEALTAAIPVARLRALLLEQTDGRLETLLEEPDLEEGEDDPTADAVLVPVATAKAKRAKTSKLDDANARLAAMSDARNATTDEDLAAVREYMSASPVGIAQVAALVGWPDDVDGYQRAGNALCHMRDALREVDSIDGPGGLRFQRGNGTRIRLDADGEEVARIAPEASPASAEDVLGAMLESKPQTVAQIASFLGLGVARVAPTVEALIAAGKVEQAKTKGRYAQFVRVAA
jgi:hypothetical protein